MKRGFPYWPDDTRKAASFHEQLHAGEADHHVSLGWLQCFKHCHGIRQLSVLGEQKSVDDSTMEGYRQHLQSIIHEGSYKHEQLYNADESGLFWHALSDKTLASTTEKQVSRHKVQKDRIAIFPCVNITGTHKLPLVYIGHYANPHCFKNLFPMKYKSQNKPRMTYPLFQEEFVPAVRLYLASAGLEQCALLLVDNAGAHTVKGSQLESPDGGVKCLFLPLNTTSKLQLLNQGIITIMKK